MLLTLLFYTTPFMVDTVDKESWIWRVGSLFCLPKEGLEFQVQSLFPYKHCCPVRAELSGVTSLTTFCQHSSAFETVRGRGTPPSRGPAGVLLCLNDLPATLPPLILWDLRSPLLRIPLFTFKHSRFSSRF